MSAGGAFLLGLTGGAGAAGAVFWAVMRRREARMGRALSFAAHELNTPLTAVHMTVINFLSGVFGDVSPDHLKWLNLLRAQSSRLGGVVGDMRDFIHLAIRGDFSIRTEEASVLEAIESVVQNVGSSVAESSSRLVLEVPAHLPCARADPERLPRMLSGLLFHARKFRTSGDVLLKAEPAAGFVEISVEYAGRPLPPGEAERSLELFYTAAHGREETLSAVGMGLGLSRALARLQGGELDLACDASGRARLSLRLPRMVSLAEK